MPQTPAYMNSTANALSNADKRSRIEKRINVPASKMDSIDDNNTELTLLSGIASFLTETFLGNPSSKAYAWSWRILESGALSQCG